MGLFEQGERAFAQRQLDYQRDQERAAAEAAERARPKTPDFLEEVVSALVAANMHPIDIWRTDRTGPEQRSVPTTWVANGWLIVLGQIEYLVMRDGIRQSERHWVLRHREGLSYGGRASGHYYGYRTYVGSPPTFVAADLGIGEPRARDFADIVYAISTGRAKIGDGGVIHIERQSIG